MNTEKVCINVKEFASAVIYGSITGSHVIYGSHKFSHQSNNLERIAKRADSAANPKFWAPNFFVLAVNTALAIRAMEIASW